MSRPRNERGPGRHGSVGDQYRAGQLSGGVRGSRVWVNSARLGVGLQVEVTPLEAEQFADGLYEWARQARLNQARLKDQP